MAYDSLISDVQQVLVDGLGLIEESQDEVVIYHAAFPATLVVDMEAAIRTLQRIESALFLARDGGDISYDRPF